MSDIRRRLLELAEQHPELRNHFLELAHMGVGEGVPYQSRQSYGWDDEDEWDSEMMAAQKRNLINPCSSSCDPLQKNEEADPNPTRRGDGNCYQKHHEYGSGVSKNKANYMKKYRALQKAQGVTHAPDGALSKGRPDGKKPSQNRNRKKTTQRTAYEAKKKRLD